MKKLLATALLFFATATSTYAFSISDARNIVNSFYGNVKRIAEGVYPGGQQTEAFVTARNNALELCFNNWINLPNEFAEFNFSTNDPFLEASTYIKRLLDFSIERHPKISAQIVKVQALEEIKSTKSENSKNFYEVHVRKTITVGKNDSKVYTDVVSIFAPKGKIVSIVNESGGENDESIIELRKKAAKYFADKQYDESFAMYLKIIEKDQEQGDAYYRLGLMAYHKLGCKKRYANSEERRRAAYDYIKKATRLGDYKLREQAEHVLYYMKYGGV